MSHIKLLLWSTQQRLKGRFRFAAEFTSPHSNSQVATIALELLEHASVVKPRFFWRLNQIKANALPAFGSRLQLFWFRLQRNTRIQSELSSYKVSQLKESMGKKVFLISLRRIVPLSSKHVFETFLELVDGWSDFSARKPSKEAGVGLLLHKQRNWSRYNVATFSSGWSQAHRKARAINDNEIMTKIIGNIYILSFLRSKWKSLACKIVSNLFYFAFI